MLWLLLNAALFAETFIRFRSAESKRPLYNALGEGLTFARGFAQLINFNAAFILIPVSRLFLTRLRSTFLSNFIPFDKNIKFHGVMGLAVLLFGLAHT